MAYLRIRADRRDIVDLILGHRNKVGITIKLSHNLFAGGWSFLQHVKCATPVKSNKMNEEQ